MTRLFKALTVAAFLWFAGLAILFAITLFDSGFEVINNSGQPVTVIAQWRDESLNLGSIAAMSSYEFDVSDEAAMTFLVNYSNGERVQSEPIYFTNGLKVKAVITQDGVTVGYDDQTW